MPQRPCETRLKRFCVECFGTVILKGEFYEVIQAVFKKPGVPAFRGPLWADRFRECSRNDRKAGTPVSACPVGRELGTLRKGVPRLTHSPRAISSPWWRFARSLATHASATLRNVVKAFLCRVFRHGNFEREFYGICLLGTAPCNRIGRVM